MNPYTIASDFTPQQIILFAEEFGINPDKIYVDDHSSTNHNLNRSSNIPMDSRGINQTKIKTNHSN